MASAEGILFEGLKALAFYEQRFAKPLIGAFEGTDMAPHAYLSDLFVRIPQSYREEAAKLALLHIVNSCEHCPSPKDVRSILADAVLKTQQLSFSSLYEKAKFFLAFPPETPEAAGEWINRVIFSSIRHLGRERFTIVTEEEWSIAVADVIFGDVELVQYIPNPKKAPTLKQHDFKKLLNTKQ